MSTVKRHQISRKTPNKKRHTKPCKFFQTMQCPFSADECDFAHVTSSEPSKSTRTKPCRYFVAGHCSEGLWCRFKHPVELATTGIPVEGSTLFSQQSADIRDIDPALTRREMRKYPRRGGRNFSAIGSHGHGSCSSPSSGFPITPVYSEWPNYPNAYLINKSAASIPTNPPPISPTSTNDSSESGATLIEARTPSESSSSTTDDVIMVMEDLQVSTSASSSTPNCVTSFVPPPSPHSHYIPSTPATCKPASHVMIPPAFCLPYYFPRRQTMVHPRPKPPVSKEKLASFRTKPCKFYKPGNVCPEGDRCTFIHDQSNVDGVALSFGSIGPQSSEALPAKSHHDLPPKPVSLQEINNKKGYFPVSWRVIGGGVKMGAQKSESDEYQVSALEDVVISPQQEGSLDSERQKQSEDLRRRHSAQTPRNAKQLSITVPQRSNTEVFPSTSESDYQITDPQPTADPIVPRQRPRAISESMSPTTSIHRRDLQTLFSAESPGVL